jgi:hypothetical protein
MRPYLVLPLLSGLVFAACGQTSAQTPTLPDGNSMVMGLEPEFRLEDVNTSSERYGDGVSPRDYLQKVTGWYFGWAT